LRGAVGKYLKQSSLGSYQKKKSANATVGVGKTEHSSIKKSLGRVRHAAKNAERRWLRGMKKSKATTFPLRGKSAASPCSSLSGGAPAANRRFRAGFRRWGEVMVSVGPLRCGMLGLGRGQRGGIGVPTCRKKSPSIRKRGGFFPGLGGQGGDTSRSGCL